jgi:hypothetical protein
MLKLICIDAITGSGKQELTFGKEYEILKIYDKIEGRQFIGVVNDSNILSDYLVSRFVTPQKWREIQINKIIKE